MGTSEMKGCERGVSRAVRERVGQVRVCERLQDGREGAA